MSIHYALYIDTGYSTATDEDIGLVDGVFRLVTDRPVYDGADNPYPTWEDTASNTDVWYNGIISKDGLGSSSRYIDIKTSGNYGVMSDFSFELSNPKAVLSSLSTNGVYLVGKVVKKYVVIDDVFYQVWNGVISDISNNETRLKIDCKDTFTQIHKKLPPVEINKSTYPDSTEDSKGSFVPVCIGDVPYAKIINTEGESEPVPLFVFGETTMYCAAANEYTDGPFSIDLKLTEAATIIENLIDGETYFLRVVKGTGADTEKLIRISDAEITLAAGNIFVTFTLEQRIEGLKDATTPYYTSNPTSNTWYFQIVKLSIKNVVSQNPIKSFSVSVKTGAADLWSYDDVKGYEEAPELVQEVSSATSPAYIKVINNSITTNGEKTAIQFHIPTVSKIILKNGSESDAPELIDRDRTTLRQITTADTRSPLFNFNEGSVLIKIPDSIINENHKNIYIAFDCRVVLNSGFGDTSNLYLENAKILDPYMHAIGENILSNSSNFGFSLTDAPNHLNCIPNFYYDNGGNDNGEASQWSDGIFTAAANSSDCQKDLVINSSFIDYIKSGYASPWIELNFKVDPYSILFGEFTINTYLKQITFITETSLNIVSDNVYARASGEFTDPSDVTPADESNTVYRAFKHILENYDGIATANIDYGNLATYRHNTDSAFWHVGRQLTENKNSFDYLKELCKQSFVAMFPKRDGNRGLSAWIENTATTFSHDESTIKRGSINTFKRTSFNELFNNFKIKYSWSPGAKKFDGSFNIDKLEEATFPDSTTDTNGDGVEDWKLYFSGLLDNDDVSSYAEAKKIWEKCKIVYSRINTLVEAPKDLTELNWFIDRTIFDAAATQSIGASSSAFMFLKLLVDWTARQKVENQYEVPLNSANVSLEIMDRGTFSDVIHTNDTAYGEWIVGIAVNPKTDTIEIAGIIEPDAVDNIDADYPGDIVESGIWLDTITESGSHDDTYTEDGA